MNASRPWPVQGRPFSGEWGWGGGLGCVHVRARARGVAPAAGLQRKSVFHRNANLFPPGINQDKSSPNPVKTRPARPPLWSSDPGEDGWSQSVSITLPLPRVPTPGLHLFIRETNPQNVRRCLQCSHSVTLVRAAVRLVKESIT